MHIPFTPLCNLHFNIDYVVQLTVKYLMCVYIFEQRIWRTQDLAQLPNNSRLWWLRLNAQLKIDRLWFFIVVFYHLVLPYLCYGLQCPLCIYNTNKYYQFNGVSDWLNRKQETLKYTFRSLYLAATTRVKNESMKKQNIILKRPVSKCITNYQTVVLEWQFDNLNRGVYLFCPLHNADSSN